MHAMKPSVGQWYRGVTNELFEVVALDDEDQTIEIQYFDGTGAEMDFESWNDQLLDRMLDAADAPEDWSGAVDVEIEDLKVYYFEATSIAGQTILRYELIDRIRPYCMFISATERALIKRGAEDGGRKIVNYVPNNFHQAPRLLIDEIGIDTFICTVSPMDRHGYFSFGVGNDYSTKVARSAKRLIVEVNENMPRVSGAAADEKRNSMASFRLFAGSELSLGTVLASAISES